MLVVDTNIIVPLYVRASASEAVRELRERDAVWRTDPFALIEFSNVLATYERARYLTKAMAQECLAHAQSFLRPHYFSVKHEAALELAIRHRLTAFDGRWITPLLNEPTESLCRAETAQRLQGRDHLWRRGVAADPNCNTGVPVLRDSELDSTARCVANHGWIPDRIDHRV